MKKKTTNKSIIIIIKVCAHAHTTYGSCILRTHSLASAYYYHSQEQMNEIGCISFVLFRFLSSSFLSISSIIICYFSFVFLTVHCLIAFTLCWQKKKNILKIEYIRRDKKNTKIKKMVFVEFEPMHFYFTLLWYIYKSLVSFDCFFFLFV